MLFNKVPTPCVGICSTTYGDVVCRGCRRYLHEVIDWNRYSDAQKRLIWQRLDAVQEQVLRTAFRIDDSDLLREKLDTYRIPFRGDASPWAWLHALLRSAAKQEPDLAEFGVTRLDRSELRLADLRERLNGDMRALAAAYYEKDFLRAERNAAAAGIQASRNEP
ncbi:MAG: hypothetical protein K0S46_2366 [Moraxellaceae bacterium]|jgi:predicted Fe-S protein YdhL (DUF1289 family)|nr:hypothetical protein [Moraxellaceae bacterium]